MAKKNSNRLGLDLGANSIGWCLVGIDGEGAPQSVIGCGVVLLTPNQEAGRDPQSNATFAADRRVKRSMRKRRDRFVRRRDRLMEVLIAAGLMPKEKAARKALEHLDPYALRAKALDEAVTAYELGRALFHLNQRRGFKSNRIADGKDSEQSAMKTGMRALENELAQYGADTLGQYQYKERMRQEKALAERGEKRSGVRFRPRQNGAKIEYPLYPHRDMVAEELRLILQTQRQHHTQIDDALVRKLNRIIIEQRPLKPQLVGKCTFRPDEERAPKALPTFQRFRVLSDLASLRVEIPSVGARRLTLAERDALANLLMSRNSLVSFEAMRRALKSLPDDARFNYEKQDRKGFDPDLTAARLVKAYGKDWRGLPRERQCQIIERLISEENPKVLVSWLQETIGVSRDIAEVMSEVRLPQGYGSLGRSILSDLIDAMESESKETVDPRTGEIYSAPLNYDEAVEALGLHHSDHRPGELLSELPYYGDVLKRHVIERPDAREDTQERRGRVPNPTVHIALNQTRRLINALIKEYGRPEEIVLELGRELKWDQKRKDEYQKQLKKNTEANERRKEELAALQDTYGLSVEFNGETRLRLRLFDELPADERTCVYSGKPICRQNLFDGSIEVDHILPFSKTLDDGIGNKVLCTREANRRKGARAPADAFSGAELRGISERAERLFKHKAWRFQPDAMEKFEETRGFIDRHLVDTQHLSRLVKTYLGYVCDPDHVWAAPGKMTAMLRGLWGLSSLLPAHNAQSGTKNRNDHRHHAIDAFVLACTHRGLLQEIARRAGRVEDQDGARLLDRETVPEPFDGYRAALREKLEAVIVCHKADHGIDPKAEGVRRRQSTAGRLHEETAFGLVEEEIDGKVFNLVTRKNIAELTEKEINQVRDTRLREQLRKVRDDVADDKGKIDKKHLAEMLSVFGFEHGIRRVRVLKRDEYRVIEHGENPKGGSHKKAYAPGENHRIEIYETTDGRWRGEGVTVFDAHLSKYAPKLQNSGQGSKLVMRVHKGDMIEANFDGARKVYRVYQLDAKAGRLKLAAHNESGSLQKRHDDESDPFRWEMKSYTVLKAAGAQRVRVDPLGRVKVITDR